MERTACSLTCSPHRLRGGRMQLSGTAAHEAALSASQAMLPAAADDAACFNSTTGTAAVLVTKGHPIPLATTIAARSGRFCGLAMSHRTSRLTFPSERLMRTALIVLHQVEDLFPPHRLQPRRNPGLWGGRVRNRTWCRWPSLPSGVPGAGQCRRREGHGAENAGSDGLRSAPSRSIAS